MAVRTLVPKSPSPARRSRSPRASAAPSSVSCTPRTKRRPVSSGRVSLLVISLLVISVSSPGQGRGADGGVPELRLLVLQRHQGDRDAVHVEADRTSVGTARGCE